MHESPEEAGVGCQQQLGLERELQLGLVGVREGGEAAPGAQLASLNQLTLTGPACWLQTLLQNTMPVW